MERRCRSESAKVDGRHFLPTAFTHHSVGGIMFVLQLEALPPWLARSWCSTHAMCAHVLLNRQVEWAIVPYSPFPLPVTSKCPSRQQAPSWRGRIRQPNRCALALGALLTSVGHAERPRRVGSAGYWERRLRAVHYFGSRSPVADCENMHTAKIILSPYTTGTAQDGSRAARPLQYIICCATHTPKYNSYTQSIRHL